MPSESAAPEGHLAATSDDGCIDVWRAAVSSECQVLQLAVSAARLPPARSR